MECTGETAEEAERSLLEECCYNIEIEEVEEYTTEPDKDVTSILLDDASDANFEAQRLDNKYDGVPADTLPDSYNSSLLH